MSYIYTPDMITLGRCETYKNKREFGRKMRLVMEDLKQSVPPEYIQYAVWCNEKPIPRAHDLYTRLGCISVKIRIPKETV